MTVQVTEVVPLGNDVPDGGLQVGTPTPGQLSLTAGRLKLTTAEHRPRAAGTEIFCGGVIEGSCISTTVTVNEQLGPAVDVHVTVVVPMGKDAPDAGEHVIVPQPVPVGGE